MAANFCLVYVDDNNYVYMKADIGNNYYLILENELQYINWLGDSCWILGSYVSSSNPVIPQNPVIMTEEQYNQIQNGTFQYGVAPVSTKIHFRSGTQRPEFFIFYN